MASNSGKRAQLTGERAETKVRDALLDAELFCSKYEHDRGEDLLVELEGYLDGAPIDGPRIGLLQIKGHDADSDAPAETDKIKRKLRLGHLCRWAAIPLPVFVVAVEIHGNDAKFFARSVDRLVCEVAPDGLGVLDQDTITVALPFVSSLPTFLTTEVEEFYSAHAFRLAGLSDNVVARNHYEILSSHIYPMPPTAKVWLKHLRVLWKGPWRPAHFWSTLNHIADNLHEKEGGQAVPLMATFHVYRSLRDERDNNAIAHVSWLEDSHSKIDDTRALINWPKATHWARFQFNGKASLDALPEYSASEEDDELYLGKAEQLWSKLDALYTQIASTLTSKMRIDDGKRQRLERKLMKLHDYYDKIGSPSPQFKVIDQMLSQYSFALSGVLAWLKGKPDVPEIRRQRWLKEDLEFAESHFGSFRALVKVLRGG